MSGFRVRTARARSRRLLKPHHALEEELEDQPPPRAPPPSPAQEPTLGLLGAALHVGMLTAGSYVRALVPEGARVPLPKKATLDGQSPQSDPKATHHRTCLAALTDTTGLTEGPSCPLRDSVDAPDITHAWGFHPGSRDPMRSRGQALAWQGDVTQRLPKLAILPTCCCCFGDDIHACVCPHTEYPAEDGQD